MHCLTLSRGRGVRQIYLSVRNFRFSHGRMISFNLFFFLLLIFIYYEHFLKKWRKKIENWGRYGTFVGAGSNIQDIVVYLSSHDDIPKLWKLYHAFQIIVCTSYEGHCFFTCGKCINLEWFWLHQYTTTYYFSIIVYGSFPGNYLDTSGLLYEISFAYSIRIDIESSKCR